MEVWNGSYDVENDFAYPLSGIVQQNDSYFVKMWGSSYTVEVCKGSYTVEA